MRVKKQRRHRKSVRFYCACFGFREPFKILCDGTFVHHLLSYQINPATDALANILGASSTKLFTTRCVIAELKSLGESYYPSFQAASSLPIARCDHEKRKSVAGCIQEVVGENNSEHFFVASQDADLRKTLQGMPGVPVIFGLRKSLFLESPSDFQRQFVKSTEEKHLHITDLEFKMLQRNTKVRVAHEIVKDSSDMHESFGDQLVASKSLTKNGAIPMRIGVKDRPQFKRKKAKGPNPLSCKKKKSLVDQQLSSNQDKKDGDNEGKKKIRKRKRRSKKSIVGDTVS